MTLATRSISILAVLAAASVAGGCGAASNHPSAGCKAAPRALSQAQRVRPGLPAFEKPTTYGIAAGAGDPSYPFGRAVAIADLDTSGGNDLVAVNPADATSRVSVLLNRGDGTFAARRDYATGKGADALAVRDLDCDGRPDLVTANGGSGSVSVLLNRGDGSFGPQHAYRTSTTPWAVAIADLDGDGYPDLAVANLNGKPAVAGEFGSVSILLNDGRGRFGAPESYSTGGGYPEDIAATDLDGDGRPDLAVANGDGHLVSLLHNRGGGRFESGRRYLYGTGDAALAGGDLDGDGKVDLALIWTDTSDEVQEEGVTIEPSYVETLLGHGDGSLSPPRRSFVSGYSELAGEPVLADLSGDGHQDVIFPRWDDGHTIVSALLNDGRGGFRDQARVDYLIGGDRGADGIAFGDLNGDGVPDVVGANFESSTLKVFLGEAGRCTVQDVSGDTAHVYDLTVAAANRALERANCRLGRVTRGTGVRAITKGRIFAQSPRFGAVLPAGSPVDVVVAR